MAQHDNDHGEIAREERFIYLLLALVGTPIVIVAFVERDFDAGSTISLACLILAIAGLLHLLRRGSRIPTARVRR